MSASRINRGWLRSIAAVAFVATTGYAISAQAGECPTDKCMPNARQPVNLPASVAQVRLTQDDKMIHALATDRSDQPFGAA